MVVPGPVGQDPSAARAALAADMAKLAQASASYLRDNEAAYPLATRRPVTIADLVAHGYLPAGFADRAGDGIARSPFGEPYAISAYRTSEERPVEAVVYEAGAPLPEKLRAAGVEADPASVLDLKMQAAADLAEGRDVDAGTLLGGARTARAPGGAWTLDLARWLAAAPAGPGLVALVNFEALRAGTGGGGPPQEVVFGEKRKLWQGCEYRQMRLSLGQTWASWNDLGGCGPPGPDLCPDGPGTHYEATPVVVDCYSAAAITILPSGGALTNGWVDIETPEPDWQANCPVGFPACMNSYRRGSITMNDTTISHAECWWKHWVSGRLDTSWSQPATAVGVCCSYVWDRPDACRPAP